jgi:hypothetical protein
MLLTLIDWRSRYMNKPELDNGFQGFSDVRNLLDHAHKTHNLGKARSVAQYTEVSDLAEATARRTGQVVYLEDTKYGWQVTSDATNAAVAVSPNGNRQYLR